MYAQKLTLEASILGPLRYASIAFEGEGDSRFRLRSEPSFGFDSRLSFGVSERFRLYTGYRWLEYNAGWSAETVGYYRQQFNAHTIPFGVGYSYAFGKRKRLQLQSSLSFNFVIVQHVNVPFFPTDYDAYRVMRSDKTISWVSEGLNNNTIKNHLAPEAGLSLEWWPKRKYGFVLGNSFQYSGGLIGTSNATINVTTNSTGVTKTTRLSTRDYKSYFLLRLGFTLSLFDRK